MLEQVHSPQTLLESLPLQRSGERVRVDLMVRMIAQLPVMVLLTARPMVQQRAAIQLIVVATAAVATAAMRFAESEGQ